MTSHLRRFLAGAGVLLRLWPAVALGQQAPTCSSRVTCEPGVALQGASVTIADYGIGAYTNAEGRYSFPVPGTRSSGQLARVTARGIGYVPKAVNVTISGGTITQD